jgi:hypothetical protein
MPARLGMVEEIKKSHLYSLRFCTEGTQHAQTDMAIRRLRKDLKCQDRESERRRILTGAPVA